ncbi:MAG TPA: CopD family protein, partial [Candidatus Dormibacteraeota bacterium]|nr:CopD family protein [Candidatus Dormibacteraeota bacterium]
LGGLGSFVVRRLGRMPPRIGWADPPMHIAFATALAGGLGLLALQPGWLVVPRVAAEALALVLCLKGRPLVAPFAVLAAGLLAITGHASGAGAMFADALHVLSAGMWAGGVLGLGSLRPPGGWRTVEAKALLDRFGRVAVIAFGVTALTGVLRATELLHDVSDLWTTTYGIVLGLKTAGVLVMLALAPAWRRGPFEAYAAVFVVGATALLAALPAPA